MAMIAPASASDWHYVIGERREEQQVNLCHDLSDVEHIAAVFAERGPRAGYDALAAGYSCTLAVASFTPQNIVAQVALGTDTAHGYTIRFVAVENDQGELRYVITTRDVQESSSLP